jgi:hypothetical protein
MHLTRFLLAAVSTALVTAACGGKVVVDTPGAGGSTSTSATGTGAGGTFQNTVGASVTAVSSGGVGCLSTCAEALSKGGAVCADNGLGSMDYQALYACGCGPSMCASACNFSLCTATPLDMPCVECLGAVCGGALAGCEGS